jgi:multicomponent Na+:H+ antiporter subunit F
VTFTIDPSDATLVTFAFLSLGLVLAIIRLVRGPSLPDRVVALELTSLLAAGMIVTYGVNRNEAVFIDVAIALALVAFLATIAFARYIERSVR